MCMYNFMKNNGTNAWSYNTIAKIVYKQLTKNYRLVGY